jgi:site-specific recombinase XerD
MNQRLCDYLKEQGACCKPSTVGAYRLVLKRFYDRLKIENITALTPDELRGYLLYLCGRPLAPYTKVIYLLTVKKYLAWEVEQATISEELLEVLDQRHFPKVPEYLPRPLSSENDHLLQEKLRTSECPYAPLFLILRHTGMRISELIHLPTDCVMTTPKNEKYLKVPLGKMNNERLVPLTEEALSWIETIKNSSPLKPRRQDKTRLASLSGSVASVYPLLALHFKKILRDMTDGNNPITFHRLRHTYATTLLTGGVSLVSLMKLLGHRRIEMTLRYAKVTPSHLRNEYFKAIRVLESQSLLTKIKTDEAVDELHPSDLIAQIGSFLNNAGSVPSLQKKNLLLRLSRIKADLSKIHFRKKFKVYLPGENR